MSTEHERVFINTESAIRHYRQQADGDTHPTAILLLIDIPDNNLIPVRTYETMTYYLKSGAYDIYPVRLFTLRHYPQVSHGADVPRSQTIESNWQGISNFDGRLITISNKCYVNITHRRTKFFRAEYPLACIGTRSSTEREILLFKPNSTTLEQLYREFCSTKLSADDDITSILSKVCQQTRKVFAKRSNKEVIAVNQQWRGDSARLRNGTLVPAIPIQYYIVKQTGVCRHLTLLACYFLERLVQDQHLPDAVIHFQRDNIPGGAHAWVMVKFSNALHIVDPSFEQHFDIYQNEEQFCQTYGESAFSNIMDRYYDVYHLPTLTLSL